MEIIPVYPTSPGTRGLDVLHTLKRAGINTIIYFAISYVLFAHQRRNPAATLITAILWGCAMALFARSNPTPYDLIVFEDRLSTRFSGNWRLRSGVTVHRGSVTTLIERKTGLLASDRGRLMTWLFGGIWIPCSLPEYHDLKRLLMTWTKPQPEIRRF